MESRTGYTFVDDSQMSVCEKINKYFAKKTSEDSSSDADSLDSFSHLVRNFLIYLVPTFNLEAVIVNAKI